jgi:uncharacterized membrane-anchored protein
MNWWSFAAGIDTPTVISIAWQGQKLEMLTVIIAVAATLVIGRVTLTAYIRYLTPNTRAGRD